MQLPQSLSNHLQLKLFGLVFLEKIAGIGSEEGHFEKCVVTVQFLNIYKPRWVIGIRGKCWFDVLELDTAGAPLIPLNNPLVAHGAKKTTSRWVWSYSVNPRAIYLPYPDLLATLYSVSSPWASSIAAAVSLRAQGLMLCTSVWGDVWCETASVFDNLVMTIHAVGAGIGCNVFFFFY